MNRVFTTTDARSGPAELYARAATVHEGSARLLLAHGNEPEAALAARFARQARALVAWHEAPARPGPSRPAPRAAPVLADLVDEALDAAIVFLGADFGNIQLVDPRTKALRIVCQRGFGRVFLDHFAIVEDDGGTACATAASARRQAVIADVDADPAFAPHRAVAAASGFRAVQSTPLIDAKGHLHGVLSTHFRSVHEPPAQALKGIARFARIIAEALARQRDRRAAA